MKHKLKIFYIAFCTATILVGSAVLYFYQNLDGTAFFPVFTFKVDQLALKTDKPVYHPGDNIFIFNSLCKNREYEARTTWRLYNETVITFPDKGTQLSSIGCFDNKKFLVGIVPPYALPGVHHLEGTTAIKISRFRTVYFSFRSVDFLVE